MPEHRALKASSGAQGFAIVLLYVNNDYKKTKKNSLAIADVGMSGADVLSYRIRQISLYRSWHSK